MLKPVERICGVEPEAPGELRVSMFALNDEVKDYFYFNASQHLVIRNAANELWFSNDAGLSWSQPELFVSFKSTNMISDSYFGKRAFFLGSDETLIWTEDGGATFKKMKTPGPPNRLRVEPIITHPDEPSYLIWNSDKDCDSSFSSNCHVETWVSKDTGYSWSHIVNYARQCAWARTKELRTPSKETIFCQVFDVTEGNQKSMGQKTKRALKKSLNSGKKMETVLESTMEFATYYEYMIAAKVN